MTQQLLPIRIVATTALAIALCGSWQVAGARLTERGEATASMGSKTIKKYAVLAAAEPGKPAKPSVAAKPGSPQLDRSGKARHGKASFYAPKFAGRKMADGTPMNPRGDNAASKTLPLGTVARVTNLETGQSADVTIRDRGPYVPGRIVDLSPATAEQIGLDRNQGVAPVQVAPIIVPPQDAKPEPGSAAR